ncbi:hypothetical protein [Kitasatospora terrestris]
MNSSDDAFLRKVREIQEARDKAIRPLAAVLVERERLRTLLAETDGPYGAAYADAEAAGWRTEELAALGAEQPLRRPKVRLRRAGSNRARIPAPVNADEAAQDAEAAAGR